jgi:hypothetical protein
MTTAQWLRAAARRIGHGSSYLCWSISRRAAGTARRWAGGIRGWLGAASGWEWCLRTGILLVLALVARKLGGGLLGAVAAHADRAAWLLWPLTIGWCIAAYRTHDRPRVLPPPPDKLTDEKPAADAEGEADDPTPAPDEDAARPAFADLIATAQKVGTPHVHIAVLAKELGTTTAAVRERLTAAGVPIEPVRMKGHGSSTGVRHEDIAPHYPPPPAPSEGVVGAGQETNNNDNNTQGLRVTRSAGGAQITINDSSKHHTTTSGREVNEP